MARRAATSRSTSCAAPSPAASSAICAIFGANFCKTAGAGLHQRNFAVEIAIVDSGGQAIWKRKDISGYVRCMG